MSKSEIKSRKNKLQRQVLSDWSGLPYPTEISSSPANLEAAFQKIFVRIGLGARFQETTLTELWEELVGPTLASHCRPQTIRRGILLISVDHPAWLQQINLSHKLDILRTLQKRFPYLKIKDLQFRIG